MNIMEGLFLMGGHQQAEILPPPPSKSYQNPKSSVMFVNLLKKMYISLRNLKKYVKLFTFFLLKCSETYKKMSNQNRTKNKIFIEIFELHR